MSDEQASNYSIQPRYPYPQSPPMGSLAAADSYSPSDWPAGPAELPDIGAPLVSPGLQVSAGQPWANRLVDTLTTPRAAEDDNTVLYKTASPRVNFTQADINRGLDLGLSFSGGGLGIKAYHGSPHDFDRFDMSKIGTGEGAQAYGHGLYFAENEGVAKSYRDALAQQNNVAIAPLDREAVKYVQQYGSVDAARSAIDAEMEQWKNSPHTVEQLRALRGALREPDPGHMYEVNINADPAHFLDWDKPLSGQYSQIQRQLADVYPDLKGETVQQAFPYGIRPQISEALNKSGIPGIKYLDQGSRAAFVPTSSQHLYKPWGGKLDVPKPSSNYVVFNDKLIDIMRKYGLAGAAPAGMGALAAQDNYPPQ